MQLYPILLIAVVIAADSRLTLWGEGPPPPAGVALIMACVPMAVALVLAWAATTRLAKSAAARGRPEALLRADRIARWTRAFAILNHAVAVLGFGWVSAIRGVVGDAILVDELVAIAPPLVGLLATWWIYYPVEQQLREALLLRRLDLGQPVYPLPSRWRYVLLQARIHLFLILAPVLLIAGLSEAVTILGRKLWGEEGDVAAWASQAAAIATALVVFISAPVLARLLLDVRPLAPGPLRDELLAICRRHRVRVRQILLWSTSGTMINAAVMGLIAPLRYVLMTDALIETMSRPQLHAVMAHEIGHVRRHHMPWLIACLMATLMVSVMGIEGVLTWLSAWPALARWEEESAVRVLLAAMGELAIGLTLFGWVCRRFERQADTFAVQHLSGAGEDGAGSGAGGIEVGAGAEPRISAAAVYTMQSALETIARLNAINPHRPSWRHGSIAWRQRYLESLVGRPVSGPAIDRQVSWIKAGAAVVLLGSILLSLLASPSPGHPHPSVVDAKAKIQGFHSP